MPAPRHALAALALAAAFATAPAAAFETTLSRDGVSLEYRDPSDALDAAMRTRIIDTFFASYARERADFNPSAPKQVVITIDPGYDGVAYVDDKGWATMTINPAWLKKHPGDTDLVTHEAMHIVQGYPDYANDKAPVWLVEGIADYARDRYGIDNAASGWKLPEEVKAGQNYDTDYRVSGAFLKWADAQHPGLVHALDGALRQGRYTPALWRERAGHDVATLWQQYVQARGGAKPAEG